MQTILTEEICQDQVSFFAQEGYLRLRDRIFSTEKFNSLKNIFEETLDQLVPGEKPEKHMDKPHLKDKRLFEFLFADEILDIIETFIGPNIGLFSSHFICKMGSKDGPRVPWHEDSAYWGDFFMDYNSVITFWLALDPSTRENGCLKIIPGSHLLPDSIYDPVDTDSNFFGGVVQPGQFNESSAVALELEPNFASLHAGKIIHGSEPNTSGQRRTGLAIRYFSAESKLNQGKKYAENEVYLARGKNLAGNIYTNP